MLLESVLSLKCPLTTEPKLKNQGQTFPQLTWLRMNNKEFSASLWGSNGSAKEPEHSLRVLLFTWG